MLAAKIGVRNVANEDALAAAAAYIHEVFSSTSLVVTSQSYLADTYPVRNIIAELPGKLLPQEIVIIGAHFDSAPDSPGANDNASGMAVLLELARSLAGCKFARTIRFVAFTCEEDPFYQTEHMGSYVYSRMCRKRKDRIACMISLETIGFFSRIPGSQSYPFFLGMRYGSVADHIAFVSNLKYRRLTAEGMRLFRAGSDIRAIQISLPGWFPGIGASDQWSFWRQGYPAMMITDTANLRYEHFHLASDTPDKICYPELTNVLLGILHMIENMSTV